MMRSLYSGVSGLRNHQIRMDVVSNNVSNVNTIGFKRGRVTFQDMISQEIAGASRPREGRGGINPKQVGLGMQVAAIDTIHTQGAIQVTGKITDVAMMGQGFFVQKLGERVFYTRAGNFGMTGRSFSLTLLTVIKFRDGILPPCRTEEHLLTLPLRPVIFKFPSVINSLHAQRQT